MTEQEVSAEAVAETPTLRRSHVAIVILLPAVVQAIIVRLFAVTMLVWDEFHYAALFRLIGEGHPWRGWIWQQHNEHRIVWTKLLMIAHASFSGWNPVVEMYASAVLMYVISAGIWILYRRAGGNTALGFVPVALLLCSLANYMNMLYGLMTCHYFTLAGIVWAIVFLARGTRMGLLAAVGAAFVAMTSTLNAVLIWPIGLIVLLLTRQKWPRWVFWLLGTAASAYVYFRSYHTPPHHVRSLDLSVRGLLELAIGGLTCLGSPLSAGSFAWARSLGVVTVLLIAAAWIGVAKLRDYERHVGAIALTLFGLGCVAMTAVGRRGPAVLESKYVLYSTLALTGAYLSLAGLHRYRLRPVLLTSCIAVVAVGLLAANAHGFKAAKQWRQERLTARYVLQTADIQPDEALAGIFFPTEIRKIAAYLRATGLGPFRYRVDALKATRWREGVPTAEIARNAPVEATFQCPVETLRDVSVNLSPSAPPVGRIQFTITKSGKRLGETSVDAATITELRPVSIVLDEPLRNCRGRTLVVELKSTGEAPATHIHAWTYPAYYSGIVRQANTEVLQRSLGISFNAIASGLLP